MIFEVNIDNDLPEIYADQNKIKQVILNLLDNAARFTDKGEISLTVAAKNGDLEVRVTDTGRGLAEEEINSIFDEFWPYENILGDEKNVGIGLFISKRFIEAHQGKIWVESALGKGMTFSFIIPFEKPRIREKDILIA